MTTHGAEGNSGSSKAYQASIPCMRLMDGICIVVAELVENGIDPLPVLGGDQVANHALQSGGVGVKS